MILIEHNYSAFAPSVQVCLGLEDQFESGNSRIACQYDFAPANDDIPAAEQGVVAASEVDVAADLSYECYARQNSRPPGRPSTRPWHQRRHIGNLPVSRTIPHDDMVELLDAHAHASVIRQPLNWFVTIRPGAIETIDPALRSNFWRKERNRIAQAARNDNIKTASIWSRESDRDDGSAEHMHQLIHWPKAKIQKLEASLRERYPEPHEVDIRPASDVARCGLDGRHLSIVGYLLKYHRPGSRSNMVRRKGGCPIVGKRAGCSRNIGAGAVAAFRQTLQSAA